MPQHEVSCHDLTTPDKQQDHDITVQRYTLKLGILGSLHYVIYEWRVKVFCQALTVFQTLKNLTDFGGFYREGTLDRCLISNML